MTKFNVTYAANYGGVYLTPNWDNIPDNDDDVYNNVVDDIGDEGGDNLPEFVHEHANNWEHKLSDDAIVELRKLALEIINKYLPNVTLDEVGFEYDKFST